MSGRLRKTLARGTRPTTDNPDDVARFVRKNGPMSPMREADDATADDGSRFQDDSQGLWTFTDQDILVVCPNCDAPAIVRIIAQDERHQARSDRELACDHCLLRRLSGSVLLLRGGLRDPFLHLPLWLQTPCGSHTLWAFNEAHIDFLRAVFRAKLREDAPGSHVTENYSGRLPHWVVNRKNRTQVLKALDQLQAKAAQHRELA
jgi:hypothetical protein